MCKYSTSLDTSFEISSSSLFFPTHSVHFICEQFLEEEENESINLWHENEIMFCLKSREEAAARAEI